MDVRRLLTAVGAGIVTVGFAAVAQPPAAAAAPATPKGFAVTRTADDARKIKVSWKAVTDAHHYVVSTVAGNVETVVNVPASALSYTVDAPDVCTSYKVKVGASDASGAITWTSVWTINALTPSYVAGMATGRADEGATLTATWRTPSWTGYTPLTGFRVVVSRASDGVVLSDTTSMDTALRFPGVDPARAYTVSVGTINEFGACNTAKSLIDRYRPGDPTGLVVQRRADAPGTVEVVWRAATTGPAPTYYTIGYGEAKVTKSVRVEAPATSATLPLDMSKTWVIEVKAFNANGGSGALAGSVPVYEGPSGTTPAPVPTPTPSSPTGDPTTDSRTTTTTVTTGADRTPPTIIASLSMPARNGYFRTPVTIHFTCADNSGPVAKCPADIPVATDGIAQRFAGTAVDKAGNTATVSLPLNVDQVAPSISSTVTGAETADGWFKSPPSIAYTCADTTSGVNTLAICPTAVTVTADGANQRLTGTAADKAGNTATDTVFINLDRVAPSITATVLGDTNADGWFTAAPTVHFTCNDMLSGVGACPADRKVTEEGRGQIITGTATDRAGNTASASVTVNVDETAPSLLPDVQGDFGVEGWFRGAPTLHWNCVDGGTGVQDCPADTTVGEGADQLFDGTATDRAGNSVTVTTVVSVDNTAPAISATVVGTPSADGWFRTTPTVHFTCDDVLSGIAGCPADIEVTADGVRTLTGVATDKAGNTAGTSVTVNVDRAAPAITATVVGGASADGWYRTLPTVHFTCTDEGSGIAGCPADVPVPAAGQGRVVSGTATDKAGNTTSTSVSVDVDQVAPVITATVDGVKNAAGWYRAAPTVHFTCTDTVSGVSDCPADVTVTANGARTVSGTAVDKAGNTATATVTVNVDLVAPEVSTTIDGTRNAAGWYRSAPTVRFTCADTVSGVATCPAASTVATQGAGIAVPGTATDLAGNSTTATATVNVDRTAPVVTVVGAANGAKFGPDAGPAVSCATTDTGSGVATKATATQTSNERGVYTVVCAGAVDVAGNAAAPVTVTYTVEASVNWLIALTNQYLASNGQGQAVQNEFDTMITKRQWVPFMAKVLVASIGKKPALTANQASVLLYWAVVIALRG
ncbi:Neogenin [Actinoplanes sp. NBRC 103695]|uniref:Neogenin n=1 Tax=Actinoplanes sp. NBRC 103695 TaxID=3032202 RepID=UPI0024A43BBC|nr:Neogenin [Actinoplanes sp. NBRC 103695]GLY98700.1 hypothetical protein Acsp02_59540 [Actinoplanes sp. NBRC 103695]